MHDDLAEQLVDALGVSYGVHPGHRAAHAKGVLCGATFHPTAAATSLSRALHLLGPPVRAHVRFSNGSGDPRAADAARDGRGMAIKMYLPGGGTTDIVALSLPAFFARTPTDLLAFNEARRADPSTGQPDVAKVGAYLAEHPEAIPAVTAAMTHPIPASYATLGYHALHAFGFVAADDTVRYGRYHLVPAAGEVALTDDEAGARAQDYLVVELADRLGRGPAVFDLDVQMAGADDPIDDPTAQWPSDRELIALGRLRPRRQWRCPGVRSDAGSRRDRSPRRRDPARAPRRVFGVRRAALMTRLRRALCAPRDLRLRVARGRRDCARRAS